MAFRCARKLPENVKSVEAPKPENDVKKNDNPFSGSPQSKSVTTAANAGTVKTELGIILVKYLSISV